MIRKLVLSCLFLVAYGLSAGQDRARQTQEYPFLIYDSQDRLSTMRQSNENYLSAYRMAVRGLNSSVSARTSLGVQFLAVGLFLNPLTHEEGHRAVLTHENIGSISQPFFNKHMAAYVRGVRDQELKTLRDTRFPTYIRLYTAGLESDYASLLRSNSLISWQQESESVLWVEYYFRKVSLIAYYMTGLFRMEFDLKEEADELQRDIVGHDVYGAARHLHRPDMEFKRYTAYSDLTREEKRFVNRVGWRSMLNLLDPFLFRKMGFVLKNGNRINFMTGYAMVPFGDFIEQNVWYKTSKVNAHGYIRMYQNKHTWFPAVGISRVGIPLADRLFSDVSLHGWQQPRTLGFNTSSKKAGGAIDLMCKYRFHSPQAKGVGISLNLGVVAKTEGFLLEEMAMDDHIGVRFGSSIFF